MTIKDDLTDRAFGKLIVLGEDFNRKNKVGIYWMCLCECGNITSVSASNLRSNHIKSCGQCNYEKLEAQKFGKLTVLKEVRDEDGEIKKYKNGAVFWECQCECGNVKIVRSGDLKSGHTGSCGKCSYEDLTNNIYGKLRVLGPAKNECGEIKVGKDHCIIWICQCECGNFKEVKSYNLRYERTMSCGKCDVLELVGKKFGKLSIVEFIRDKNIVKCICECGSSVETKLAYLKSGHKKSCNKCKHKNLMGSVFGKLKVIGEAKNSEGNIKKTKWGAILWECICECGQVVEIVANSLKSGVTKSCGCLRCSKYVSQNELARAISKIFNAKIFQNYQKFEWLKNIKNLETDIYVPSIKLAVEYDGEQHTQSVDFFGGCQKLEKQKKLDTIKNNLIQQHIHNGGNDIKYFIRFSYKDKLTEEAVREKLKNIIGEL